MSEKPALDKFVANAKAYKTAEWGDGSILDAIMQIIEMFMPFIESSFTMRTKEQAVETCHDPSRRELAAATRHARRCSRKVGGLSIRDRLAAANEAVDAIVGTANVMTENEIGDCYDEIVA